MKRLTAFVLILMSAGCSRDQVPQPTQEHRLTTNEVKAIETEKSPGAAAFCMIANYPVDHKQIIRESKFNKVCWRILKETKKEESERLYAQLADAAIRQQVSHETLERRGIQVEGLWRRIWCGVLTSFLRDSRPGATHLGAIRSKGNLR